MEPPLAKVDSAEAEARTVIKVTTVGKANFIFDLFVLICFDFFFDLILVISLCVWFNWITSVVSFILFVCFDLIVLIVCLFSFYEGSITISSFTLPLE